MKMLLALLFPISVFAVSPKTIELNNQAVKELEAGNFSGAEKVLIDALATDPMFPELHYNLGLAFLGGGQVEKAISSFEFAAKQAVKPETKFMANFNLGFIHGKNQKIDEALKFYQKALEVVPESVETKTNIELLVQEQQNQKDKKGDKKDPNQKKDGEGNPEQQPDKNDKEQDEKEKEQQEKEGKKYEKPKPQPKQFKSEELTQGDVNKILGEIKQQEQKIRAEFNKKEAKEKPRAKDW